MLQKKYERGQNYVRNNLGIAAACGGNRIGTDHKRSIFVTVYRHCYGSFDLYRIFSYCNAGYGDQRRIYQFRGGCMEYRYFHVPDPVGHHGGTDEQGRRLCSLRRMGEKACKDQSGSAAFHLFIRCSDFRG